MRPSVTRVLETSLYVDDLERATSFYEEVLGLEPLYRSERLVPLQAGAGSMLLLFRRGATSGGAATPDGWIPPHDATGPAHFALAIARADLDAWRKHLAARAVEIESEVKWARGGVSLYVRDPDGHSVELATPGVWPTY